VTKPLFSASRPLRRFYTDRSDTVHRNCYSFYLFSPIGSYPKGVGDKLRGSLRGQSVRARPEEAIQSSAKKRQAVQQEGLGNRRGPFVALTLQLPCSAANSSPKRALATD
jgi:hypothetical protein